MKDVNVRETNCEANIGTVSVVHRRRLDLPYYIEDRQFTDAGYEAVNNFIACVTGDRSMRVVNHTSYRDCLGVSICG